MKIFVLLFFWEAFSSSFITFIFSVLSIGKYPTNSNFCPFRPLAISANNILLGPTKGFTTTFICCATSMSSWPGSAMPGQPASLKIAIVLPSFIFCLNVFICSSSTLWIVYHSYWSIVISLQILFKKRLVVRSFSAKITSHFFTASTL